MTLDACTRGAGIWGLQPLGITLFSPRHLGLWTKRELKLLSDYCLSVARCRELHPFYHDPLKLHLCPACAWLCPPLLNVTQPSLWSWQPRCGNVQPFFHHFCSVTNTTGCEDNAEPRKQSQSWTLICLISTMYYISNQHDFMTWSLLWHPHLESPAAHSHYSFTTVLHARMQPKKTPKV